MWIVWICETVAYSEGVRMLKPTCDSNCCSLRRALSLGRVKASKHVNVVDLRDCRIFRGGWDVETKLSEIVILPKEEP